MTGERESSKEQQRHHAPAQDGERRRPIIESGTVEPRVRIQISPFAHFSPRRIDAQRDERQTQADDPDAEIFAGATGEREAEQLFVAGGLGHGARNGSGGTIRNRGGIVRRPLTGEP